MDDDDLAGSLSGLSGLLTEHRPLQETLIHIAEFAVQAIPGADGAGRFPRVAGAASSSLVLVTVDLAPVGGDERAGDPQLAAAS